MTRWRPTWLAWFHGTAPCRRDVAATYLASAVVAWTVLDASWPWWLALVAADVGGGVVSSVTRSTGRWYAARSRRTQTTYVGLHLLHLLAIAAATGASLLWATTTFLFVAAAVMAVRTVPPSSALPVAFALVAVGTTVHGHPLDTSAIVPLLMVKLIVGFGVHARRDRVD
jgi:hypothetical protein